MPSHEPLIPWNQDASYMLSESIFLQQGLKACALTSCSESGSKSPPSPYWTQFIFSFFPSQKLITSSSAYQTESSNIFPLLSMPCSTFFSGLQLPYPLTPSLNILFFFNKFHMIKECRLQTESFPINQGQGHSELPSAPHNKVDPFYFFLFPFFFEFILFYFYTAGAY